MMTDPLGDMLARIRNAYQAGHADLLCPSSRLKLAVARVLAEEGFLAGVDVEPVEGKAHLRIRLRYGADGAPILDGLRRVSRPGRRVYVAAKGIPRVRSGLGAAVLSTPRGVLSDRTARAEAIGGEILCEVW
jgi:small subunit ribosomal protein S8